MSLCEWWWTGLLPWNCRNGEMSGEMSSQSSKTPPRLPAEGPPSSTWGMVLNGPQRFSDGIPGMWNLREEMWVFPDCRHILRLSFCKRERESVCVCVWTSFALQSLLQFACSFFSVRENSNWLNQKLESTEIYLAIVQCKEVSGWRWELLTVVLH